MIDILLFLRDLNEEKNYLNVKKHLKKMKLQAQGLLRKLIKDGED